MSRMKRSGINKEYIDPSCAPQNDLYRYANGRWLRSYCLPEDRPGSGTLHEINDRNTRSLFDIISACRVDADGEEGLIASLAASFMDTDRIEQLGISALEEDLSKLRGACSKAELARAMSGIQGVGLQALLPGSPTVKGVLELMGDQDARDPDRYVITLIQSGLGLPDKIYYEDARFSQIREHYSVHIRTLLQKADLPDVPAEVIDEAVQTILNIETRLAAGHGDLAERRDPDRVYNPMTWEELSAAAPSFPWDAWAEGWGCPEALKLGVNVQWPPFLGALSALWRDTPLKQLRQWLLFRILSARAPFLGSELSRESYRFNEQLLKGAKREPLRWERCVALCNLLICDAVGKRFVSRCFSSRAKEHIGKMIERILEAYRVAIEGADWMSAATKAQALEKLSLFKADVGYPDSWRDYSSLRFAPDDLIGNIRSAARHEAMLVFSRVGAEPDRSSWLLPPQATNAYYLASQNKIVFLAGILQPPLFDPDIDDAANYGAIGAVLAHEISHGFDDQGSKYDGQGRMHVWWKAADREEFEKRTRALASQYDAYVPEGLSGEYHVNGAATVGEAIADLGGLSIAVLAYQLSLQGGESPVLDGMTGMQRLFCSWAQFWRFAIRPEEAIRRLAVDVHAPNEFRANGTVRNIPEFYEAFGLKNGDALYLPPENRVKIW